VGVDPDGYVGGMVGFSDLVGSLVLVGSSDLVGPLVLTVGAVGGEVGGSVFSMHIHVLPDFIA
jgi:hypothetical protein